jgi:hypothetical protein
MIEYILIWILCGILLDALTMFLIARKENDNILVIIKEAPIYAHIIMVVFPPSILIAWEIFLFD